MGIKSNFLSGKGAVLAIAMLIGSSSGAMLYADAPVEDNLIVAQAGRIIKGTITDQNGEPMIGCNVTVVGTQTGVITDIDGNFSLNITSDARQLKVSYIGYADQIVTIGARTEIKITLKEDNNALEEVVVVGYGVQKKATLTGAVEQVQSQALENRAVSNVGLALQGQTPGLVVTRSSSRPGNEGLNFQIRGATSVNGGSPLIIIDGVPAVNGVSFQNMNMDDIENISVLKDGAASIYGAKAANGVILVTTKKGKGKVSVDYNFNMRFTTTGITSYSPSMQEYATMWLEANKEETNPNWWGWGSKEVLERMQTGYEGIYWVNNETWGNEIFIANANRIDEMFARRYSYQHTLGISGSTEKSDYRISAAYADNQGNLATAYDGQKQINLRLNYGIQLAKWLKLETGASMVRTNTSSPSTGLDKTLYGNDMPFFPAKNPLGQWNANFGKIGDRNAAAATSDGGRDENTNLTTRVDLKAIADIWKGISFEVMASFQNEEYRRERYVIPVQTYTWFGEKAGIITSTNQSFSNTTDPGNIKDESNPGYYSAANNLFYQYYSAFLKYNRTFFDVHNVSAAIGINAEKTEYKGLSAGREFFEDTGVYDLNLATGLLGNAGGKSHNGTYSYIMRLNYNYAEKYLLEVLGRRDGDSKFADGYRFKNFASFSLGWIFTQENFMKVVHPVLDFGKLRFSYGNSGNNAGLGNYEYVSTVSKGTSVLGSTPAKQVSSGLSNNGLIGLERTWEKVRQKNIGVDLAFFNNRLTTNFDYFWKDNIGMLVKVSHPTVLGATAPATNSGHLSVKGWELNIGWRDQVADFKYSVRFNIGDTKSLLKEMEGADSYGAGNNKTVNGYPLNSWFLYRTDGFFKNQEEVDRYFELYSAGAEAITTVNKGTDGALRPGDVKRLDLNGDYRITANGNENSDLQFVGDANPHYVFGFALGGSWKGFDFDAFFQGVGKQYIMRTGFMAYPFYAIYSNQNPNFLGKTWTESNPNAEFPRLSVKAERGQWNYQNNDFMLQNSRYVRLKSLVVGYTLPKAWTQKVKLEKVRFYFSGNDLWEWTSIKDGFDPEAGEATNNAGYPFARTWSFGLNIGF